MSLRFLKPVQCITAPHLSSKRACSQASATRAGCPANAAISSTCTCPPLLVAKSKKIKREAKAKVL